MRIPTVYGPYYAWCAGKVFTVDTESEVVSASTATSYAFALCLSLFTTLVLLGLINAGRRLEDPFTGQGIDDIRVSEDCESFRMFLTENFERAKKRRRQRKEFVH